MPTGTIIDQRIRGSEDVRDTSNLLPPPARSESGAAGSAFAESVYGGAAPRSVPTRSAESRELSSRSLSCPAMFTTNWRVLPKFS